MRFLLELYKRWQLPIIMIAAVLVFYFGFAAADNAAKLRAAKLEAERQRQTEESLRTAIAALSRSNTRVNEINERAERSVREILNEEVTTGCGPSVHAAVNSLRNQQQSASPRGNVGMHRRGADSRWTPD